MKNRSLLDFGYEQKQPSVAPLADRMRPRNLGEFVGQSHMLAPGKMLRRMIEADRITSIILYGPPGVGKTTIARMIATASERDFRSLNAVTSGVKDLKDVIESSKANLSVSGRSAILFIDEIHRFNKSQQDVLLSAVESGTITLIGATTENPFFEVNAALISRSTVFELKPLAPDEILQVLKNALSDSERGLGGIAAAKEDALSWLASAADGDARVALNALELGFLTTSPSEDGLIWLNSEILAECVQKRIVKYDKTSNNHYDMISAFIKSMRGSDPDAAIYWLARMLVGGEDPKFIARRMLIFASEDVGNANPDAITLAASVFKATEVIGMPECQLNLAQGVIYLACCPKSNSATNAIYAANSDVAKGTSAQVPSSLRSDPIRKKDDAKYLYPHDFPGHVVDQDYLPEGFRPHYYTPGELGYEKQMATYLAFVQQAKKRQRPH